MKAISLFFIVLFGMVEPLGSKGSTAGKKKKTKKQRICAQYGIEALTSKQSLAQQ